MVTQTECGSSQIHSLRVVVALLLDVLSTAFSSCKAPCRSTSQWARNGGDKPGAAGAGRPALSVPGKSVAAAPAASLQCLSSSARTLQDALIVPAQLVAMQTSASSLGDVLL